MADDAVLHVDVQEYEALVQFLYSAPIGLLQARLDGEISLVNPVCSQLLMPLAGAAGLANLYDALQALAPDLRQRVQSFGRPHGLVCEGLQLPVYLGPAARRDARVLSLTVLKLDNERLMAVLHDITHSVRCERELRDSQAWTQAVGSALADHAVIRLDSNGRVAAWNPGIGRLTGHDASLLGGSYARLHAPHALPDRLAADRLLDALACGWSLDEGWMQRADGSRFWGSCLLTPLPPDTEEQPPRARGFSLVLRDISDRREVTNELLASMTRDHLTGLSNRRAFFDAAQRELDRRARAQRPLCVVMVDVDHFKQINDRHGHAAGDAVLRHLAAGLCASSRALDLVARLGGEEFALLLPGVAAGDALALAQRLCAVLAAQPVHVDGQAIGCTISAGVAAMGDDVADLQALLARADEALYAAKREGRNRALPWQRPVAVAP